MTNSSSINAEVAVPADHSDDSRRYALTAPRGVSPFHDNLSPSADHHTITVYGSGDLARRLAEADTAGVCVSWRQLDDDTDGA